MNMTEQSADNLIKICEIFESIQGEGPYTGVPSIFIRTAGCNLFCKWGSHHCDTLYANDNIKRYKDVHVDDVVKDIELFGNLNIKHIVISGGESLIYKGTNLLIKKLLKIGYYVTLETNGTKELSIIDNFIDKIKYNLSWKKRLLISISPKLATSTPHGTLSKVHEENRIKLDVLKSLMKFNYIFKFVYYKINDLAEIESLHVDLNIPVHKIYLMPFGTDIRTIKKNMLEIVEHCKDFGYNLSNRLHIFLWGKKRGV